MTQQRPFADLEAVWEKARADAQRAFQLRAEGKTLYAIAIELGRSKEWLREMGVR